MLQQRRYRQNIRGDQSSKNACRAHGLTQSLLDAFRALEERCPQTSACLRPGDHQHDFATNLFDGCSCRASYCFRDRSLGRLRLSVLQQGRGRAGRLPLFHAGAVQGGRRRPHQLLPAELLASADCAASASQPASSRAALTGRLGSRPIRDRRRMRKPADPAVHRSETARWIKLNFSLTRAGSIRENARIAEGCGMSSHVPKRRPGHSRLWMQS